MLALIRQSRAGGERGGPPHAEVVAAYTALAAAAHADGDALVAERQLQALCSFAPAGSVASVKIVMWALGALCFEASAARAAQLARAKDALLALEACLSSDIPSLALAAATAFSAAACSRAAVSMLLERAAGVFGTAAARLAASAPRAAAAEAGLRRELIAAGLPADSDLCCHLLGAATNAIIGCNGLALDPHLQLLPACVALLSHPDAAVARAAAAPLLYSMGCPKRERMQAQQQLLALTERGLLRGIGAALLAAPTDPDCRIDGFYTQSMIAGAVACLLQFPLDAAPERLAGAAAAAWAAAAPRLIELLSGSHFECTWDHLSSVAAANAAQGYSPSAGSGGGGGSGGADGGAQHDSVYGLCTRIGYDVWSKENYAALGDWPCKATAMLELMMRWVPRARRIVEAAQGTSSGSPTQRLCRSCAACGRMRADGVRLRRCRGCGPLTGVMYCGAECAREHWVRRGHRGVCEPASAQLKQLREEVFAVWRVPTATPVASGDSGAAA